MSRKMDIRETHNQINLYEWTSVGTARSNFLGILKNESLEKQIFVPNFPKFIKKLKQQFARIHIGSELFFQAFDFLIWIEEEDGKNKIIGQRFIVMLCGILLMRRANIFGSMCIPWELLKNQISTILLNADFSKDKLSPNNWQKWLLTSFKFSKSENFENTLFVENNSLIYFYKNWILESELVTLIRNRVKIKLNSPPRKLIYKSIENVLVRDPVCFGEEAIKLSLEQKKAIFLAIYSPFLIITGGPGTGKTSLAVTILRVLKRLGLANNPALVSPTGRAAKRMYESVISSISSIKNISTLNHDKELLGVAAEAKTLHRLLGYSHLKNFFKHNEFEPLEYDLLIVDEASMIDHNMMTNLFKAAYSKLPHYPPIPRIILLGDADQLPAVGSGAVLSELTSFSNKNEKEDLDKNQFQIVSLYQSYRQKSKDSSGKNILGVAKTIKDMVEIKNTKLLFEKDIHLNQETIQVVKSIEEVVLEKVTFLNQTNSQEKLRDFALWWVEKFLSNEKFLSEIQKVYSYEEFDSDAPIMEYLLKYLDRFRVLTITHVYSTGAKAINKIIRELWLNKKGTKNIFSEHYPGEPVMVTKNDYLLDLFNGDIGIFLNFLNPDSGKLELKAVFQVDGVFKTFYPNELFNLQTAYAITVHKSQGSEYANLALILPELNIESFELDPKIQKFRETMTNEIIYTALTRAKKSVLILGKQSVLEFLVLNKVMRFSGLGKKFFE